MEYPLCLFACGFAGVWVGDCVVMFVVWFAIIVLIVLWLCASLFWFGVLVVLACF